MATLVWASSEIEILSSFETRFRKCQLSASLRLWNTSAAVYVTTYPRQWRVQLTRYSSLFCPCATEIGHVNFAFFFFFSPFVVMGHLGPIPVINISYLFSIVFKRTQPWYEIGISWPHPIDLCGLSHYCQSVSKDSVPALWPLMTLLPSAYGCVPITIMVRVM